jgi:hypothetical protein
MREAPAQATDPAVELYPGAPLEAVAIELTFPAVLDAHARFGSFHRKHRGEFGTVVFPGDVEPYDGERPRTTLLLSDSSERAIAIGAEQIVAVAYNYKTGFAGFTSWALPLLAEAVAAIDVTPNSARYRYENVVTLDDEMRFHDAFTIALPSGRGAEPQVSNVRLYWKQSWPNACTVDVWLDNFKAVAKEGTVEMNIAGNSPITADVGAAVREAHRCARLTFESLITDTYRQKLRQSK